MDFRSFRYLFCEIYIALDGLHPYVDPRFKNLY